MMVRMMYIYHEHKLITAFILTFSFICLKLSSANRIALFSRSSSAFLLTLGRGNASSSAVSPCSAVRGASCKMTFLLVTLAALIMWISLARVVCLSDYFKTMELETWSVQ